MTARDAVCRGSMDWFPSVTLPLGVSPTTMLTTAFRRSDPDSTAVEDGALTVSQGPCGAPDPRLRCEALPGSPHCAAHEHSPGGPCCEGVPSRHLPTSWHLLLLLTGRFPLVTAAQVSTLFSRSPRMRFHGGWFIPALIEQQEESAIHISTSIPYKAAHSDALAPAAACSGLSFGELIPLSIGVEEVKDAYV